jgi:hypothetical protein
VVNLLLLVWLLLLRVDSYGGVGKS